jgi:hypothetical protein
MSFSGCYVFTSRSLVTASNSGDSSASALTSLLVGFQLSTNSLAQIVLLITSRHGPRRRHRSLLYPNRFRGYTPARDDVTQQRVCMLQYNVFLRLWALFSAICIKSVHVTRCGQNFRGCVMIRQWRRLLRHCYTVARLRQEPKSPWRGSRWRSIIQDMTSPQRHFRQRIVQQNPLCDYKNYFILLYLWAG